MTFQGTLMFGLGFMSFLPAIFNFVGLFLLWQINCSFVYVFYQTFRIEILDFGLQNSDIRLKISEIRSTTELLYFYIDIYLFVE